MWQQCAKHGRKLRHILQRFHMFIQFIKANCIWRVCVHDSSSPWWDAVHGLSKTKGSKSVGATLGVTAGEPPLFQQMEQISRNVFLLSSPEFAGAARSGECDQPLCLSVLSGEICGVTWVNQASQLSGKIITQSRAFWITLEAIGRLGCDMDHSVTITPLNETLPHHSLIESWLLPMRTGQEEFKTSSTTHCTVYSCNISTNMI